MKVTCSLAKKKINTIMLTMEFASAIDGTTQRKIR